MSALSRKKGPAPEIAPSRLASSHGELGLTGALGVPGVPPVTMGNEKLSATLGVAKSGNRNDGPPIPPLNSRTTGRSLTTPAGPCTWSRRCETLVSGHRGIGGEQRRIIKAHKGILND